MTILKRMAEDPPPLTPESALRAMRDAYVRARAHPPASATEIEDAIIAYGRILWPYRRAFEVLVRRALDAHDLALFSQRLANGLRVKFAEWKRAGGTLAALHDATRLHGFTPEERGRICAALLGAREDAEQRVRAAVAADASEYRRLITEYAAIQHELDGHLAALQRLAERVREYPEIVAAIREATREFQRGFAALAREPETREVCAAIETYRERHEQARRRRTRESHPHIFG